MTPQEKFKERNEIIDQAIALQEPFRVPCVPLISTYPLYEYGSSIKENMYEPRKSHEAFLQFHREFEPDMAFGNPCIFSGKALDILEPAFLRWPGGKDGILPDDQSYQFLEDLMPVIQEDEWTEMLQSTTGWFLSKYFPRNFKALRPLSNIKLGMNSFTGFDRLWSMANPMMIEALQKLMQAIQLNMDYFNATLELGNKLTELGFPGMIGGSIMAPFDVLGDMGLGTEESMVALLERPGEVLEAVERITEDLLKDVELMVIQDRPIKKIWMYLHKGMDEFMSMEQYEKFYWRPLLRVVEALAEGGYTPILQCQGNYYTRLPFLKELPKGKCICFFENMDMALAKKELSGVCCIGGNLSVTTLEFGKKEEVVTETKRLLDICAPGGGYIFSTNATLERCNRKNLEAMFDVCLNYRG